MIEISGGVGWGLPSTLSRSANRDARVPCKLHKERNARSSLSATVMS